MFLVRWEERGPFGFCQAEQKPMQRGLIKLAKGDYITVGDIFRVVHVFQIFRLGGLLLFLWSSLVGLLFSSEFSFSKKSHVYSVD